jgi:HlyD family secretion protein
MILGDFCIRPSCLLGKPAVEAPHNAPVASDPPAARPRGQLGDRVRSLRLSHIPDRRTNYWNYLIVGGLLAIGAFALFRYRDSIRALLASQPAAPPASLPNSDPPATTALKPVSTPGSTIPPAAPAAEPPKGEIALESKGYIVPAHQILVSPKVSGMIMSLDVEEGKRVAKGDVLAVLETTDYEADVERAKATVRLQQEKLRELENGNRPEEIKQAEAELGEAEATLAQLTAEFKRSTDLRKNNSITAQQYELAESQYKAMQQKVQRLTQALALMRLGERVERIEVAKAELAQAQADLVKAQWRLGNCTIRAPISGTILKKNAEEGNIVNPIAFNGSFSLCEMADLSDLEVDLNIQERDISAIQVGQKCRVRAEAWPNRVYEGVVDRLMPIADRAKGAIPVRVKISIPADEEGVYLKPEMGAIVTFLNVSPAADVEQTSSLRE